MNIQPELTRAPASGFVLVVTLILLVLLTISAVFSMRGVALQERMAVGQVAGLGSFLDSEQLAWGAVSCIREGYYDDDGDLWPDPPWERTNGTSGAAISEEDLAASCSGAGVDVQWVEPRYTILAGTIFRETGAFTPVALEVETPGGGGVPPIPMPPLTYGCFGENCGFTPAASGASASASGNNHRSPEELGTACDTQGRAPALAGDDQVLGVAMPEADFTNGTTGGGQGQGQGGVAPIIGDPPSLTEADGAAEWADWAEANDLLDPRAYVDGKIDAYLDSAIHQPAISEGEGGIFKAEWGETIRLESGGAQQSAYGVIILDGGTLEMTGQVCFSGIVLFRNGGSIVGMSGTPAILGAAIGYAPTDEEWDILDAARGTTTSDEDRVINPRKDGNPSFFYSSQAVEDAGTVIGTVTGVGPRFEIVRWRTPFGVAPATDGGS